MNIKTLAHEQLIEHVNLMIGHVRQNDLLGKLYKVQMRAIQIDLGILTFFFDQNPETYNSLTDNSKIVYIWRELYKRNVCLKHSNTWEPRQPQHNDIYIS